MNISHWPVPSFPGPWSKIKQRSMFTVRPRAVYPLSATWPQEILPSTCPGWILPGQLISLINFLFSCSHLPVTTYIIVSTERSFPLQRCQIIYSTCLGNLGPVAPGQAILRKKGNRKSGRSFRVL